MLRIGLVSQDYRFASTLYLTELEFIITNFWNQKDNFNMFELKNQRRIPVLG